jgi:hypothetical protein
MDTDALRRALIPPDPNRSMVAPSQWWVEQLLVQTTLLTFILDELRANAANRIAALDAQRVPARPVLTTAKNGEAKHGA